MTEAEVTEWVKRAKFTHECWAVDKLADEIQRLREAGDKLCSALGEGQANGDFDRRYAEAIVAWAKLRT